MADITNETANTLVEGTAANDKITNSGDNATIDGGLGNDTISNSGANVVFNYAAGDGNDVIAGFDATSTLKIGGGTGAYSSLSSENKPFVAVALAAVTFYYRFAVKRRVLSAVAVARKKLAAIKFQLRYAGKLTATFHACFAGAVTANLQV